MGRQGTTATCDAANGWRCHYGSTVSTDANGNLAPETACDGLDNDCNGTVDDLLPPVSCGIGACARTVASCDGG